MACKYADFISVELITKNEAMPILVELYERGSDDRCPENPYEGIALMPEEFYQGGYILNRLASVNFFRPFRHGIKVHFQVSKLYRKCARELLEKSLAMLKGPFYAEIPVCYPEVINFAKHQGFCEIERTENTYLRGQWVDRVVLKR
jgi:hypothetical protein